VEGKMENMMIVTASISDVQDAFCPAPSAGESLYDLPRVHVIGVNAVPRSNKCGVVCQSGRLWEYVREVANPDQ
jgi:hypothetical protein